MLLLSEDESQLAHVHTIDAVKSFWHRLIISRYQARINHRQRDAPGRILNFDD